MHLPIPSEGGEFAPPPAGAFAAICHRFIDLGTQTTTFNNETKRQRKVMLTWELTDPDERMEDGRPWTISQRYTWSMHEKSTLRKTLESWRGKSFEESDFGPGGFDVRKLLGAPCLLSLVHAEKGDKTYTNISAVTKLPKGMQPGTQVNESVYFSLDDYDSATFHKLSESLQNTIKQSPEYQALGKPKHDNGYHAPEFDTASSNWEPDLDPPF
jgi:hypothetical protein